MATHIFCGIQRLSRVLDAGIRPLNSMLRRASTSKQTRIVTGSNNEKIIMSSCGDVSYPETLIHEFVWNNSENYPNHIALECGINGKKYTFAQAKDATSYIGRSLRNMGLKTGDVVALVAPNFPDTILSCLGISSGGFIVTTINPMYTAGTFQDVIPAVLPFFHIYGMNALMFPRLSFGAKIITIPKFVPETFIDILDKNKVTALFCVPPIILFLTASPLVKKHHFHHVHLILCGAAPLAEMDVNRFYEKYNIDSQICEFRQGYGLTETSPVNFIGTGRKYSSIGQNIASCQVRLVDVMTKKDISTSGQTGELWIKGPHVMKGYLNDEDATKNTLTQDGWLKTGDIAYFDEDFDFYITDRLKELIKVKGFQVPPAELEALLRMHPDVEEAAVIGIPHERYGEVPKAFIVVKENKKPTEDDIKDFIKGKVSEYKQLRGGITFVDNIPKNSSGKILRAKMK
ncbi:PREDICTED: 4-coumarate--CoA ligase 1-like isoform X2 [Atta colombica]|uniref:4-coumarate--CoA ligase 1-like isoform X2 n=1 Tax=Atta colombica TaxID=520822 RepID=UPI00084CDC90|nr:PREDICTED: 4-coumarate--CoA ligase 1-like isoform X2 [Atta colombica]